MKMLHPEEDDASEDDELPGEIEQQEKLRPSAPPKQTGFIQAVTRQDSWRQHHQEVDRRAPGGSAPPPARRIAQ